jgi:two-component system CheB/CheR fusion protein
LKIKQLKEQNNSDLTNKIQNNLSNHILDKLTQRELEILNSILKGGSNKVIARKLNISHRTVENHRASIMKKTKVKSLMELVRVTFQLP